MEDQTVSERRRELRRAVIELRARGLNAPAKWAAEQLTGLPSSDDNDSEPSTSSSSDEEESDTFLLAKSYFDLKVKSQHIIATSDTGTNVTLFLQEYRRVAHVLRTSPGNKARFLRCYALYLAGEKRKEYACCAAAHFVMSALHLHHVLGGDGCREERVENGGPLGKEDVTNKDIEAVEAELSNARQQGTADAFALYLHGLVLIDRCSSCCLGYGQVCPLLSCSPKTSSYSAILAVHTDRVWAHLDLTPVSTAIVVGGRYPTWRGSVGCLCFVMLEGVFLYIYHVPAVYGHT